MANTTLPQVLAVGELLIDMMSSTYSEALHQVATFERFPGGSPANLGSNLARLGQSVGIVSTIGNDNFGDFLESYIASLALNADSLRRVGQPSTLILVTKSKEVSDFEVYRAADAQIVDAQFDDAILQQLKIFHTTCFALSQSPARESILRAAVVVSSAGGVVSIDANYAQKVWPNQAEAQQIVADYLALGAMVKFSEVDWERLYGQAWESPAAAAASLHEQGAHTVCLTMGGEGCYVSNGKESHQLPSRHIEIVDTTGAGDAFWSGFLCAHLDGYSLVECALAGRRMAEIKLQHLGPLPAKIDKRILYLEFEN